MKRSRRGFLAWFTDSELRPPGARREDEFLRLCIQCQRCTESCPYRAIEPAGWTFGAGMGTPVIRPERTPCYLCMICPPLCPTGALEPVAKEDVDMGEAVVDEDLCYAFQGILCRACVDACPFQGKALRQNYQLEPIVDRKFCVGCGLCVPPCPAKPVAIRVVRSELL